MYKLKFFIDFEKEEQWLEQMANEGYHLQNKFFGYHFRKGEPEKATIKIDFRMFKKKEDFIDYCTMFEDGGWKHLAGTKSSGVQYFKKWTILLEMRFFLIIIPKLPDIKDWPICFLNWQSAIYRC